MKQKTKYQRVNLKEIVLLLLIGALVIALVQKEWAVAFISIISILLSIAPYKIAEKMDMHIPRGFLDSIVLFVYATLFLGEVGDFYEKFWWWDVVLHTGSAIGFGIIGFSVLLFLFKSNKVQASPFLVSIFALSFALAIGVIWEIFEFSMDQLFGTNMQKSGLRDTMWDLIVDTLGALVASIAGYFYLKNKSKNVVSEVIEEMVDSNL